MKKSTFKFTDRSVYAICMTIILLFSFGYTVSHDWTQVKNVNVSKTQISSEISYSLVPSGAVMAFNLNTCPEGWIAADGNSTTPDLRGAFVRGMETFDGGITYNNRDPDRSGNSTLKSFQNDAFQGHRHGEGVRYNYDVASAYKWGTINDGVSSSHVYTQIGTGASSVSALTSDPVGNTQHGTSRVSSETRPDNVALLYCVKI